MFFVKNWYFVIFWVNNPLIKGEREKRGIYVWFLIKESGKSKMLGCGGKIDNCSWADVSNWKIKVCVEDHALRALRCGCPKMFHYY